MARESREELSPIEGPGLKKDALGGSRGTPSRARTETGGVAYSELAVEVGRSSAMVGGKEGQGGRRKEGAGEDARGI